MDLAVADVKQATLPMLPDTASVSLALNDPLSGCELAARAELPSKPGCGFAVQTTSAGKADVEHVS